MYKPLSFEKPLIELTEKIEELKKLSVDGNIDLSEEIKKIEERAAYMQKEIFTDLAPNQIVEIARHILRPNSLSLIKMMCDTFTELHGDRFFRDDPSIIGGPALISGHKVMIIGQQRGNDTKENIYRNFGMPHPEGYRKALRLMKMAEKFSIPIVTLIDTMGAYPGIGAEERGQAEAIARNLKEMSNLKVPIFSVVIGEGGSGGALGIAVANKIYMFQYAIYSVISPEGCASILFRDASKSPQAAENLKITAKDLLGLGVIDGIIEEPLGGAHKDWNTMALSLKEVLLKEIKTYHKKDAEEVAAERYAKFRNFGRFEE